MEPLNHKKIVNIFRDILGVSKLPFSLHEPYFNANEWRYVKECIDIGWVSSAGKFVDRFENELARITGAKYAIATSNGTAALHISYLLAGVCADDEVLVPALTFVATCNAIAYCHAVPHFVDSSYFSLGVDPEKLENYLSSIAEIKQGECINKLTGRCIRALVVMHVFGHPVDLDPLVEICNHYHIKLIEDAAEALGSCYKGEHVGHRGFSGVLSFNGNKIITTGGGGAILTNDEKIAQRAKHITTTAKTSHLWQYQHDEIGYNYRLPNINAALGCAQLEQLPIFLQIKRKLAEKYHRELNKIDGIKFVEEPEYAESNYWLNAILLASEYANQKNKLLALFNEEGVGARPVWSLMHALPMFSKSPKMDLSVAEDIYARLINIPSSAILGMENE